MTLGFSIAALLISIVALCLSFMAVAKPHVTLPDNSQDTKHDAELEKQINDHLEMLEDNI